MDEIKRLSTYVNGLDERLSSGIPEKDITLVGGTHGTMKSTFCFNILYNLARRLNLKSLYLSFEQRREPILRQMKSLGMDVDAVEDKLLVVDVGTLRKLIKEGGVPQLK